MTERKKKIILSRCMKNEIKNTVVSFLTAVAFWTLAYIYNQRYFEKPWTVAEVISFALSLVIMSGFIVANFTHRK